MVQIIPTLAAQFDLLENLLGVVIAVVGSFVLITLTASYFRFQRIVEVAEKTQPEDMGSTSANVLRVQMARCLAGCARKGSSFCVALFRFVNPAVQIQMATGVMNAIRDAARVDDISCTYDEQTGVLLFEADPEDATRIAERICATVVQACPEVLADEIRVGLSSYPGHGLRGAELIEVAAAGLAEADEDARIVMPEIIDVDAEDDEDEDEEAEAAVPDEAESAAEDAAEPNEDDGSSRREKKKKSKVVDELTGVLKPSAVSAYMQRSMSELRRKKKQVALFCVGVNNMDHITRVHGEQAANDVLAGVSKILQDHLRADDLIGRHEKYAFLMLAEASLDEAEIIGRRLSTLVQQTPFQSGAKKLKTTITLGVAVHPMHGKNLHQLYVAGQKVLDHSRENDIRAYAVYDPEIHDKMRSTPLKSLKSMNA